MHTHSPSCGDGLILISAICAQRHHEQRQVLLRLPDSFANATHSHDSRWIPRKKLMYDNRLHPSQPWTSTPSMPAK